MIHVVHRLRLPMHEDTDSDKFSISRERQAIVRLGISRKLRVAFVAIAAILAGNTWVSYRAVDSLIENSRSLQRNLRSVGLLRGLQADLDAQERMHRGYILSGDVAYLTQSLDALERALIAVMEFKRSTSNEQHRRAAQPMYEYIDAEVQRIESVRDIHVIAASGQR